MFSTGIEGNLSDFKTGGREVDYVQLAQFDADKHVLQLPTQAGRVIGIRKPAGTVLQDGDILYNDDRVIVAVRIRPRQMLQIRLENAAQAVRIGYELGTRHLPIYITQNIVKIPFDESTEQRLLKLGALPKRIQGISAKPTCAKQN